VATPKPRCRPTRLQAHLGEIYEADVSREVTDAVNDDLAAWRNRPLDRIYAVVFIDAIVRREALFDRVEVQDLHRVAVAAAA
jgi:putative transposase